MAATIQHLNVTVIDIEKCIRYYEKKGGSISKQIQLCSGGEKDVAGFCVGDSGAGLMVHGVNADPDDVTESWKLIGVASFGPPKCGTNHAPGALSKVRYYIDWILDNVSP